MATSHAALKIGIRSAGSPRRSSFAHRREFFRSCRPTRFTTGRSPERHRMIFYLGHLEAFDWNLLERAARP